MLPTLFRDLGISLIVSQQGIHTMGYISPSLVGSPQPRCGGLQSPSRTVTPIGTTLMCKAWIFTEGFKPMKDRRRRPGGGGEWEPIKIPHRNLAYIPNQTRRPFLLTQPRPPSYRQTIGPQNRARNCSGNTEWC
jgi:hypothetical protein